MTIGRRRWGTLAEHPADIFTIRNTRGASLVLSDYGARALQMNMPSPAGELADVILGFDTIESSRDSPAYFGATVGRFANRIRRGRFSLDGGTCGCDRRIWQTTYDPQSQTVTFSLVSPHLDEGSLAN